MTPFTIAPEDLEINAKGDSLATYEFGSGVAKHHFCRKCGIYVFHQTMREPGRYRVNVGCIEEINSLQLPVETFNGANI